MGYMGLRFYKIFTELTTVRTYQFTVGDTAPWWIRLDQPVVDLQGLNDKVDNIAKNRNLINITVDNLKLLIYNYYIKSFNIIEEKILKKIKLVTSGLLAGALLAGGTAFAAGELIWGGEQHHTSVSNSLDILAGRVANKNIDISRLNKELTQAQGDLAKYKDEVATDKGEIQNLKNQLTSKTNELEGKKTELANKQTELNNKVIEMEAQKQSELAQKGRELQQKIDEGNQKVAQKEKEIAEKNEQITTIQDKQTKAQNELTDLNNKLGNAERELDGLKKSYKDKETQLGESDSKLEKAKKEALELQEKADRLVRENQ